ncbi:MULTISPECIES: hybrid sensor histidine kinase/response regulator [Rhodomicrobium]|uniref:hybrid sensor histidine kinase/response regulator n=1 Tax=Rhodomicrobium TaxID=1068 RepID=UPI000B4AF1E9|nr:MULTISPECIES: hybrid sensor histidine kinase/response regulator [Rhodomicrobium]
MPAWIVILVSTAYVGILFMVAWWGDRRAARGDLFRRGGLAAICAYALTLAIYNTSWSFYGSVGRAAASGFDFLPIYIAPTFILLFCQPLLLRIYSITKAYHVNSIADFMASRYGKSQTIAAIVTIGALISVLPYIALQLKAVGASFDVATGTPGGQSAPSSGLHDTPFAVAIAMAAFAIIFGVRHVQASEHHRGLMLAIAFESLIKMAAFLTVAAFIVFGMFDGFDDLFSRAASDQRLSRLLEVDLGNPTWFSGTLISFFAFICLPQAFHVAMVENESPGHMRSSRWLYPVYLAAFSLFMVPIAVAGIVTFGGEVSPDTFMINLPIHAQSRAMTLLSFIGGFSAATGMVIVSVVALSTMLCNDVVVPAIMRAGYRGFVLGGDVGSRLLMIRRIAVVAVLLLAYAAHRLIDQNYPLTLIGLVSFVAIAQIGPAFIGGLYWRRANRYGAAAGICIGLAVWAYTLLFPSLAQGLHFVADLPFGPGWFRQNAPFATGQLDIISFSSLWSLAANCATFCAVSLLTFQKPIDRIQAEAFVGFETEGRPAQGRLRALVRLEDLKALAISFLGAATAAAVFDDYVRRRRTGAGAAVMDMGYADLDAIRFTEQLLSQAIGAASARVVMAAALENSTLSRFAAKEMLDEASEALRINHTLTRGMLEGIPQGLCAYDDKFRLTAWNNRFLTLLDLPPGFVQTGLPIQRVIEFNLTRGEHGGEALAAFIDKVEAGAPGLRWPFVYQRTRLDGRVIEIIFDRMAEGGYIATFTDVTERMQAAAALRDAKDRLELRVAERTQALEAAKADAELANAGKTRFLAAASHDLLQPLHAARLFVAALVSNLAKDAHGPDEIAEVKGRQVEHALSADAALRSTEQLIESLLDISSLDTGIVQPKIEPVSLKILLGQLKREYSVLAEERGLDFRVVANAGMIETDPGLLRRVLQNILSNAIRYTPKGKIVLGCRHRGDITRIEIWDSGVGIPPEHLRSVFEEFKRLDDTPAGDRGLGLGLAIVDRTCKLLGHRIEVRSEQGSGSVFSVLVPRLRRPEAEPPAPARPTHDALASRPLTVLCIDDEEAVRRGTKALLQEWGHRCIAAADAETALAALAGRIPDAALLDYHVGAGRTGLQVAAELQARWGRGIPMALVTANGSEAVIEQARAQSCEVLLKPLKPGALRRWLISTASRSLVP